MPVAIFCGSSFHFVILQTEMNLNKEIMRLCVPAVLSNITLPLIGLCDTSIAGHLGSEAFIGGVAVGTMMQNVVFWVFGFLRMGTTGLTSQAFGAGNDRECRRVLARAFMIAMTAGVVLIALQLPLRALLTFLIGAQKSVGELASFYFSLNIWGAPALLGTMTVSGWFLGMQTTVMPMIISITVNVTNVLLSLTLAMGFGLGFQGIAIGTLAANWLGLGLSIALVYWWRHGKPLRLPLKDIVSLQGLGRFFKVNSDIMVRSVCILAVSMTVTSIGARLGDVILAANSVMMQFFIFFSYFMDGFAFTGEALCGRMVGERDREGLFRVAKRLLWWSAGMAVSFFMIYLGFSDAIISMITDNPKVIETIADYHVWILLIPPLSVTAFIFDGFFIGLTATRKMLVATILAGAVFTAICLVPTFMAGGRVVPTPSNNLLWTAFMSYLLVRGLFLAFQTRKVFNLSLSIPLPS